MWLEYDSHTSAQVVQHGGCLGLGLAAMGTANLGKYLQLFVGGSTPCFILFLSLFSPPPPPPPPPPPDAYELLKENLMTRDDAVVGEAAGLSMGLVMLGTRSPQAIEDMTNVSK